MVQKKSGDFYGKFDVFDTELKNTGVVTSVAESGGKSLLSGKVTMVLTGKDAILPLIRISAH